MLSVYRQAASHDCAGCAQRDAEIRRLRGLDKDIHPCPFTAEASENPDETHGVNCPRCTVFAGVFRYSTRFVSDGTYSDGRTRVKSINVYDTRIHIGERYGFLWLRKCVQVPHRHRACTNCGHTWIEHARPVGWEEERRRHEEASKLQQTRSLAAYRGQPLPKPVAGTGKQSTG